MADASPVEPSPAVAAPSNAATLSDAELSAVRALINAGDLAVLTVKVPLLGLACRCPTFFADKFVPVGTRVVGGDVRRGRAGGQTRDAQASDQGGGGPTRSGCVLATAVEATPLTLFPAEAAHADNKDGVEEEEEEEEAPPRKPASKVCARALGWCVSDTPGVFVIVWVRNASPKHPSRQWPPRAPTWTTSPPTLRLRWTRTTTFAATLAARAAASLRPRPRPRSAHPRRMAMARVPRRVLFPHLHVSLMVRILLSCRSARVGSRSR